MDAPEGGPAAKKARVLVRVRPAVNREYQLDQAVEVFEGSTGIRLYSAQQTYESTYDHVFEPGSRQEAVYGHVADFVQSTLAGFNNTIFAYGQTGTGKTHTMMCPPELFASTAAATATPTATSMHGVVPRAAHDLFCQLAAKRAEQPGLRARVECSYLELYNERLYDLLQPYKRADSRDPLNISQRRAALEVKEDPTRGMCVPELLYAPVDDWQAVMQLVATGNRNRAVRMTDHNQHSSRSHVLLQLWLEQELPGQEGTVIRSKLSLVDLAGSERWGARHTSSSDTAMIAEMTAINSSLSALAMVVTAVTEKARHVPYRSSKLTHLLKDAFGGNCNTAIIATLSPCCDAFDESLASLRFADRVANVSNSAVVNRSSQSAAVALANRDKEIARLRALLASLAPGPPGTPGPPATPGAAGTAETNTGAAAGAAGVSGSAASSSRAGTAGVADMWQQQPVEGATGADVGVPAAAAAAAKLAEELEEARRALDFERALRTRLQATLYLKEQEREQQLKEQRLRAEQQLAEHQKRMEQMQHSPGHIEQQGASFAMQQSTEQPHVSTSGTGATQYTQPGAAAATQSAPIGSSSIRCSVDTPDLLRSHSPDVLLASPTHQATSGTASSTPRAAHGEVTSSSDHGPWSLPRQQQPAVTWGRSSLQRQTASPPTYPSSTAAATGTVSPGWRSPPQTAAVAAAAGPVSPGWSSDGASPRSALKQAAHRKWMPAKPWEALSSGPAPYPKSPPVRRRTVDAQLATSPPRTATSPARAVSRSRSSFPTSPLPYARRVSNSGGHDGSRPGPHRSSSQPRQRRTTSGNIGQMCVPGTSSGYGSSSSGYGSRSGYRDMPAPLRNAVSGVVMGSGIVASVNGMKPGTLIFLMGGSGNSAEAKRLSQVLAKSQSAR